MGMRRLLSAAALYLRMGLLMAAAGVQAGERPRIAIIIDDLGYALDSGRSALTLPGALTYSFLPHTPYARRLAEQAHATGREVMLHLPMEAIDKVPMGPGGLALNMDEEEFASTLRSDLGAIPHVAGVNNHMGSRLTRDPDAMQRVMASLRERGLYFVDSRTTKETVAELMAGESGVATARRHVFLDVDPSRKGVRGQFQRLLTLARQQGAALAIGHPRGATLAVLTQELPRLEQLEIDLVPASELTIPVAPGFGVLGVRHSGPRARHSDES
jgi:polysaccharide deacetylase 2 family uncharacterized protein YibQ